MSNPASGTGRPPRRRAPRGTGEQLRTDIVAATKELLSAAESSDAVSIRAVAEAVGITAPSIYLHFADKDELIAAVVIDVFADLDTTMTAAGASERGPLDRLRALGLAYVRFAVAHPEHYRVATMEQPGDDATSELSAMDRVLADGAFNQFMTTVRDCMTAGIFATEDPLPVALRLWSTAHGIASLAIAKPYLPWGDLDATTDAALCCAAIGQAAMGPVGGTAEPVQLTALAAAQRRSR